MANHISKQHLKNKNGGKSSRTGSLIAKNNVGWGEGDVVFAGGQEIKIFIRYFEILGKT